MLDRSGRFLAAVGSPGGSAILTYNAKTLVGLLAWGLTMQQAIDLPNFGAQTSATTEVEKGTVLSALQPGLAARGHTVAVVDINSGLQGIVRVRLPDGRPGWAGGADPRREGVALGD